MTVASRKQRAVTDMPPGRWEQLGRALQAWREDVLGYKVRGRFAADRGINIRLVQDLENNYRPGTYTKWALDDAARAYEIEPAARRGELAPSLLAVLRGEADTFTRAAAAPPPVRFPAPGTLPPSPMDRAREDAARPYAEPVWARLVLLRDVRGIADPSGAQLAAEPDGTRIIRIDGTPLLDADDIRVFDGSRGAMDDPDRVWLVGDLHVARLARRGSNPEAGATAG